MKITFDCDQSTPLRFKLGDGWMDRWMLLLYSITSQAKGLAHGVLDLMQTD